MESPSGGRGPRPAPRSQQYSEPLVISSRSVHRQSIIVLHGRGSTAEKFAKPFLEHPIETPSPASVKEAQPSTIQTCFPHARFVFPTASLRRAVVFNRSVIHQWFDNWSIDRPEYRQELQTEGLKETSLFIHGLLQKEIEAVGAANVVLMGLSQGCAASLIALLTWQGEAIAGAVGMCGWLPLRQQMEAAIDIPEDDGEDPFERLGSGQAPFGNAEFSRGTHLSQWLIEELELTGSDVTKSDDDAMLPCLPPIFLCHGVDDEKVPCELGRLASSFLRRLDTNCRWKEYLYLGHWYSGEMLRDIISFLQSLDGWKEGSTCASSNDVN